MTEDEEVKTIERVLTEKTPDWPPDKAPAKNLVENSAQERGQGETQEPDRKERKEKTQEIVKGRVCKKCGGPVRRLKSGAYRCVEEGRLTTALTPEEYEKLAARGDTRAPTEARTEGIIREAPSPNEILKRVLSLDPALDPKHVEWILDNIGIYGVLGTNDLSSLIQDLNINRASSTAARVVKRYAAALQHELNNDPNLQNEPEWRDLIQKESGYRVPQDGDPHAIFTPAIQAAHPPQILQPWHQQPPYAVGQPAPPWPAQGNPYPQYWPNSPSRSDGRPLSEDDIIRVIEKHEREKEERLTKEDILKIVDEYGKNVKGELSKEELLKIMEERDRKKREDEEKTALMKTLDGVMKGLDNLNARISTIEQGGLPAKTVEEGDSFDKTIRDAIAKDVSRRIIGEKGELTEEKVKSIVAESIPRPEAPPGSRNEFDMRVEQARHEADARKIEAAEKRKGYEAIAAGIRDGFQGLGFNLGAGLSAGPRAPTGPAPPQGGYGPIPVTSEPQLPVRGEDGELHLTCPGCGTDLTVPEGQARVMCPVRGCGRIISIKTEAEAEQEKTKREPKPTKVERPPRKPRRKAEEKPKEKLEKKPETGKPKSAEKPEEESNAKATKQAKGSSG